MKDPKHRHRLVIRVGRLNVLALAVLACIAALYFWIQVAEGPAYRAQADNNRLRQLTMRAPRGLIFDRHGRPLVENVPSYNLLLDRTLSEDAEASLRFAAATLGQPPEALREIVARQRSTPAYQPVLLAEGLSLSEVARFSVEHLEHPAFEIVVEHRRLYRHAHQTSHLLGYLGEVSNADLARPGSPYSPGDRVGRRGIELTYDDHLRGIDGERVVVVDSRGRLIEEYQRNSPQPGQDLKLTIDLDLQQAAAESLEGQVGAIVALDPRNGDVLAMASSPSFNPNLFGRRLSQQEWQAMIDNPYHPLQLRALQNTYPPGSVFKIVMALAALDHHGIDPKERVYCRGYSMIYNHRYRCWQAAGHGAVDLREAIKKSCNVYFHQLGQKLGIDTIAEYAHMLGLGQPTAIDFANERAGLVPDSQWSLRARRTPWYPGETISVATGQGPILVTPLQIAGMVAAVANGGRRLRPRLVASEAAVLGEPLPLAPEVLAFVREAMWSVVNEPDGTGRASKLEALAIAGKTGTAQVIGQATWTRNDQLAPEERDHAWFASFAPVADPRLVVVVFVEHGGAGSQAAAPLAKQLYETFLETDIRHRGAT